ncbi:hypothetical protein Tco_0845089 [Tanacetum coccineum]
MNGDKIKKDIEEIETINIELDHRVSKLITENEHLKQTYRQLYDSIKPTRIRSKEQYDALINQVNQKSMEISDLNASLREKVVELQLCLLVLADLTAFRTANVQHSKLDANSELLCVKCNGCMLSDNHDLCVLDFINDVNARAKSKSVKKSSKRKVWKPTRKVFTNIGYIWRPTGRTFTIVETKKSKTTFPVSQHTVIKSISANNDGPSKSCGIPQFSMFPSPRLEECRSECNHLRLLFITESPASFVHLEGVDLLTESQSPTILYTLSLEDMKASSPIISCHGLKSTKSCYGIDLYLI